MLHATRYFVAWKPPAVANTVDRVQPSRYRVNIPESRPEWTRISIAFRPTDRCPNLICKGCGFLRAMNVGQFRSPPCATWGNVITVTSSGAGSRIGSESHSELAAVSLSNVHVCVRDGCVTNSQIGTELASQHTILSLRVVFYVIDTLRTTTVCVWTHLNRRRRCVLSGQTTIWCSAIGINENNLHCSDVQHEQETKVHFDTIAQERPVFGINVETMHNKKHQCWLMILCPHMIRAFLSMWLRKRVCWRSSEQSLQISWCFVRGVVREKCDQRMIGDDFWSKKSRHRKVSSVQIEGETR
jgi:hypothetical protein